MKIVFIQPSAVPIEAKHGNMTLLKQYKGVYVTMLDILLTNVLFRYIINA